MGQGEERGKSVKRVGGRGGKRAKRSAAGKVVLEVYRRLNLKRKKNRNIFRCRCGNYWVVLGVYRRLNQNLRESFFLVQTNVSVAGVVLAV